MVTAEEQKVINALHSHWIWAPDWVDSSTHNTAGRIVHFTRTFHVSSIPEDLTVHVSADTRYKLFVNGDRIAVGPARGSSLIWYYDTINIAKDLVVGRNEIRTAIPGLTVVGGFRDKASEFVDLSTDEKWTAQVDDSIKFPTGITDDVFLHINERISPTSKCAPTKPKLYGLKFLNGDLAPWRLRPREIPMADSTQVAVNTIRASSSTLSTDDWSAYLSGSNPLTLPSNSTHTLEIQADVHSTAFLRWTFKAAKQSQLMLRITYSEGYEREPRSYPFFRTKDDRLDATGLIIGPYDEVKLDLPGSETITYEPFWFRTFRVLRFEVTAGAEPVELLTFGATQVNYPMDVKACWEQPGDPDSDKIWDVSIRTLRNCMFDGYSDCPFYEQLQYSGDSYSVGLFHYLLSGDDRLTRQAITNFAASITAEGLTQSRFPSHVPQIIAGFSPYWIMQVCEHHLFFGDSKYARSFLPRIDGVLDFYDSHIDELGLVSGFSEDVWQYVDWVTSWGATDEHPDKGVPTSGRKANRHTFFSLLYALVLQKAAKLVADVGRPGHAAEYVSRAASVIEAVQKHCFDGQFFTDSTADIADDSAYSQHCQVFAVVCGAAPPGSAGRLLQSCFADPKFSKCSYVMQFWAFRAYAIAGDDVYEGFWPTVWNPWRDMLRMNLTTWQEDDVRQRSDCHAWGSVPVYEYCTELAGVQPIAAGAMKILFKPRLRLTDELKAKVALGKDNVASVEWGKASGERQIVELKLEKAVEVVSQLPGGVKVEHGVVDHLKLVYRL